MYMMYITWFIATSCFQELLISLITCDIYPLIMHPFQNSNFCGYNIWGHITTVPTCRKSLWLLVQCYYTELPNTKITYYPVTLNRQWEEKWDQNSPPVYRKEIMSLWKAKWYNHHNRIPSSLITSCVTFQFIEELWISLFNGELTVLVRYMAPISNHAIVQNTHCTCRRHRSPLVSYTRLYTQVKWRCRKKNC